MCNKEKINQLIEMMDDFAANGGGHLEIKAEGSNMDIVETKTYKSNDCVSGDKACQIPTLHKDIDD